MAWKRQRWQRDNVLGSSGYRRPCAPLALACRTNDGTSPRAPGAARASASPMVRPITNCSPRMSMARHKVSRISGSPLSSKSRRRAPRRSSDQPSRHSMTRPVRTRAQVEALASTEAPGSSGCRLVRGSLLRNRASAVSWSGTRGGASASQSRVTPSRLCRAYSVRRTSSGLARLDSVLRLWAQPAPAPGWRGAGHPSAAAGRAGGEAR